MTEPPPTSVNVQLLMRELRSNIRGENREHDWARQARKAIPSHLTSTMGRLCAATASLRSAVAAIGEVPPAPPTLRGRLGLLLVRVVRRMVFWLVPSIRTSQYLIIDALEKHVKATEDILGVLHQTNVEIARLREQMQAQTLTWNGDTVSDLVSPAANDRPAGLR